MVTGEYEVGRDPAAFHKQRGFPYSQSVGILTRHFMERMWKIEDMKAGDVRRISRKGATLIVRELTEEEKERYYGTGILQR